MDKYRCTSEYLGVRFATIRLCIRNNREIPAQRIGNGGILSVLN